MNSDSTSYGQVILKRKTEKGDPVITPYYVGKDQYEKIVQLVLDMDGREGKVSLSVLIARETEKFYQRIRHIKKEEAQR